MKRRKGLKNLEVRTFDLVFKNSTKKEPEKLNSDDILKQLVDLHQEKSRIEHSKRHSRSRDLERICDIELTGIQKKIDELVRQRHS